MESQQGCQEAAQPLRTHSFSILPPRTISTSKAIGANEAFGVWMVPDLFGRNCLACSSQLPENGQPFWICKLPLLPAEGEKGPALDPEYHQQPIADIFVPEADGITLIPDTALAVGTKKELIRVGLVGQSPRAKPKRQK